MSKIYTPFCLDGKVDKRHQNARDLRRKLMEGLEAVQESLPKNVSIIPLTMGKFTIIDSFNYERVNRFNWYYVNKYAKADNGELGAILMHRFIVGAKACQICDHKDRDTLNNLESNLRLCDFAANTWNRVGFKKDGSYKGVEKLPGNSWRSRITFRGKMISLGCYRTAEDAAAAYNEAAKKYFGEFALLNDIFKKL